MVREARTANIAEAWKRSSAAVCVWMCCFVMGVQLRRTERKKVWWCVNLLIIHGRDRTRGGGGKLTKNPKR